MGGTNWSNTSYSNFAASASHIADDSKLFANTAAKKIDSLMDPKDLKVRECRDSDAHPDTLAVIVALDETGSMGQIPAHLVREKLPKLMESLLANKINDAQVLFLGIGDHISDHFPLQVGQFESGDVELVKWLTAINLEGNGGGQSMESYPLAWLVAGRHTSIDCFEKRGVKGVLFTIGDEGFHDKYSASWLKENMGYASSEDISAKDLYAQAEQMYHIFHIHVQEGSYPVSGKTGKTTNMRSMYTGGTGDAIASQWKELLNERFIVCEDQETIPEIIATTVAMVHGIDMDHFTKTFDDKTAASVKDALVHVSNTLSTRPKSQDGVMAL